MAPGGIPAWNAQGVIPPIDVADPTSASRSPYMVRLSDLVQRFGVTAERLTILQGLLLYRDALHAVGLTQGFQWLDGSFLEDVEMLEGRPPNDIDIVTFFRLPSGVTEMSILQRSSELFPMSGSDRQTMKQRFHVDAYYENLGALSEGIVERTTYWYSMWSHRRSGIWKGYLQIDLASDEDAGALKVLSSLRPAGAQP